jgi:hypothetical protein
MPVRWASHFWEALPSSSGGSRYLSFFKLLGVTALILGAGLAYRTYRSKPPKPLSGLNHAPPSTAKNEVQVEPLPNGIQQSQLDEVRKIFAAHVKSCRKAPKVSMLKLSEEEVKKLCKGLSNYNVFFDYLKEKKIITSYTFVPGFCDVVLDEEYIQSLNKSQETALKPPPPGRIEECLACFKKHTRRAGPNGDNYSDDDGYKFSFEAGATYVELDCTTLHTLTRNIVPDDAELFDYLVQERYIKKWHIFTRSRTCYIWLP